MRLFVAVNLPREERDRLYAETRVLREAGLPVRWVAAESLHITLKFLGEVPEQRAGAVQAAVEEAATRHAPFTLSLGGIGAFRNLRRPRVVWLGIHGAPELLALQADVESALEPLGFVKEQRPFSPHLTLGRAEDRARASGFAALESIAQRVSYEATVDVASADLMLSKLMRGGARYERMHAAMLRAAQPNEMGRRS